jgi:hypothetical protein
LADNESQRSSFRMRGTKPSCREFLSFTLVNVMPALFAYLLAISVALGGGYAGLRWLSAHDANTGQHSSASAKLPNKSKKLPEKPDSNVTRMIEAESGPKDRDKTEITANTAPSGSSNKAAPETSRNETGVSEVSLKAPTQEDDDVPTGGCMPIGLTAQGELVFPMQCQALLERHRGPLDARVPVPTNPPESAAPPRERQAAEEAPAADENTGLNRDESSSTDANAKVEDVSPSGEVKPGKESPEPEGAKGKRVGKRNMQFSHPKPALRSEDQWFNPLTFR